jgi:hypothetical protein
MTLAVLIARFTAVGMIIFGLSHLLMAGLWSELLSPLRDRKSGGLLLGAVSLPFGLVIVLGHNIWVWGLPLIVTVLGWLITLKCTIYLLVPWAHRRAMPVGPQMKRGLRIAGSVIVLLGAIAAYDAFFCRQ